MAKAEELNGTESAAFAAQICNHLSSVFTNTTATPPPLTILVEEISAASSGGGKIFVYGVGREGLMMKALCMRLFHLGLSAHCIFDMTTPPIASPDLLIASAGPGGFSTVDAICGVARNSGARVVLLTAQPETGPSVKYASVVAHIPAQTMADDRASGSGRALLPMGSVYEGALFLLFEMVVFKLGEVLGRSPDQIRARHTNLE
ncbi:Sugar isomerase family protein [Perilla frutescens var. hirtella]|uniref:Sugar isomerase family protein n=1 Tax=Perilla frutescens var. hirtella TaxID=608512 RepID=A0AAD4P6V5_PERFH|nr:Sugar isomerase family protein [Perilla frutescens var. hirtella]